MVPPVLESMPLAHQAEVARDDRSFGAVALRTDANALRHPTRRRGDHPGKEVLAGSPLCLALQSL